MKVFGNKGLGSILKIILQLVLVGGIILLILFPYILHLVNENWNIFWTIIGLIAIILLIIMYQFIGMFKSLEEDNPFNEKNITRLKITMWSSFFVSLLFLIETILAYLVYTNRNIFFIAFLSLLFLGVSIALHILKELFVKAIYYKQENDLTI